MGPHIAKPGLGAQSVAVVADSPVVLAEVLAVRHHQVLPTDPPHAAKLGLDAQDVAAVADSPVALGM